MRIVVQRVLKASVKVRETKKIAGSIKKGLFILLGIKDGDTEKIAEELGKKILKLRVMADENGKMNFSVMDIKGEILVVSQFTLYGDTSGGNRPSFIKAARPETAEPIYMNFVEVLRSSGLRVETGNFGNYMEIDCKLDGPVTIIME